MKQTFLFALMIVALAFTSCNDSLEGSSSAPGTYPDIKLYATTRLISPTQLTDDTDQDDDDQDDDAKYYFETDSGKKVFLADNAMAADYELVDGQRAVVYIALIEDYSKESDDKLEGAEYGCDYGARLFGIKKVYTTENKTVTNEEEESALADHAISYIYNSISYSHNYINMIAGFRADKIDNIRLYLVDNQVDEPSETKEKYLNLELRYDRDSDEAIGSTYDEYISINIEEYAEQLKADGMKGIILRVVTLSGGTQHIIVDIDDEEEDEDDDTEGAVATAVSTTPKI